MDATYAKGKSPEDLMRHYGAVMGVAADLPTRIMPQDHAWAILDGAGCDLILNFVSMGWTSTEIASHFKVPAMAYAKWAEKRLDPADVAIATRNFADALLTRAMYVLGHRHSSPQEQAAMNHLSKMARDLAACANPDQWMPGRIAGANTNHLAHVAINIDIGQGLAQGGGSSTFSSPYSTGVTPPTLPAAAPATVGLSPSPQMPAPTTPPPPEAVPDGGYTMGWIFGDTAPIPVTGVATGNPPTRERPNG